MEAGEGATEDATERLSGSHQPAEADHEREDESGASEPADTSDAAATAVEGGGVPLSMDAEGGGLDRRVEEEEHEMQAELDFLESLWNQAEQADAAEEPQPLFASSALLQRSEARPSYAALTSSKGVTSTKPSAEQEAARRGPRADQAALERDEEELVGLTQAFEATRTLHDKAADLVQQFLQDISDLEEERTVLLAKTPVPRERFRRVEGWLEHRKAALVAQRDILNDLQGRLLVQQAAVRAAEQNQALHEPRARTTRQALAVHKGEDRAAAGRIRRMEDRAISRIVARLEKAREQQQQRMAAAEARRKQAIAAAVKGHRGAIARLLQHHRTLQDYTRLAHGEAEAYWQKRADVVMQLKQSIAESQAQLQEKAMLYRQRQKQRKEVFEQEFKELLEAGHNPYEVWRREDVEREARLRRERIQRNILQGREAIGRKLLREELLHQQDLARVARDKAYEQRFQEEMGVSALEQRTEQYMLRTTKDGVPIQDPTSRQPFEPSAVTVAKTWRFGMARATAEELEKVSRRHPRTAEDINEQLIPRSLREAPEAALSEEQGKLQEQAEAGHDEAEVHATPEFRTTWDAAALKAVRPKAYEPRLSVFEQKAMARAHQRHKASIVQKQVVMGKEFKGRAFVASPEVALFKDFEPGQIYTLKLKLTNVSYSKNSFKVLGVPDEYMTLFDLEYTPTGAMSAGLSTHVSVTFKPRHNVDIDTSIAFLAATGEFSVPLRCLIKRAVMSVRPSHVDCTDGEGIVIGEASSGSFCIRNDGALEVDYLIRVVQAISPSDQQLTSTVSISAKGAADAAPVQAPAGGCEPAVAAAEDGSPQGELAPEAAAEQQQGAPTCPGAASSAEEDVVIERAGFLVTPVRGRVGGYSRVRIDVQFTPEDIGKASLHLEVKFRTLGRRKQAIPSEDVHIRGTACDVPLVVAEDLLDFQCCVQGHVFHHAAVLRNRGRKAMKAFVSKRPELEGFVIFNPSFGYCQAGGSLAFNIQLSPRAEMLDAWSKHVLDRERCIFEVPLSITAPDQSRPVPFRMRVQMTPSALVLDPPRLAFGPCNMAEQTAQQLRISNTSDLTQKFAFLDLPPGVRVEPNHGFGTVLPKETVELRVALQPPIAGPLSFELTCSTMMRRKFHLPCTAVGVQPALQLAPNKVRLPATALRARSGLPILVTNVDQQACAFEFAVPSGSDLSISPSVQTVPGNGSCVVQLEYAPRPDAPPPHREDGDEPEAEPDAEAAPEAPDQQQPDSQPDGPAVEADRQEDDAPADDDWHRWRRWEIPCFLQRQDGGAGEIIHLEVTTCAVTQQLLIVDPEVAFDDAAGHYVYDFGATPIGQRVLKRVVIKNEGVADAAPLVRDPMDPFSAFASVNASRTVPPRGEFRQLLAFSPPENGRYYEVVTFRSTKTSLRLALKGEGMAPHLKVEPEEVLRGMDMGNVLKGERASRSLTVTNASSFNLPFQAVFEGGLGKGGPSGLQAFYCTPAQADLEPGESRTVEVYFQPDHQAPHFADTLVISVPGLEQGRLVVPVTGRGWEVGAFLAGDGVVYEPRVGGQVSPAASSSTGCQRIDLDFPCQRVHPGETAWATLSVGSLKTAAAGGAASELVLDALPEQAVLDGWKVEPDRMQSAPGEEKPLTFLFSAPDPPLPTTAAYLGVEDYAQLVVTGMLKGGLPAPAAQDGQPVSIRARVLLKTSPRPPGEEPLPPPPAAPTGGGKGKKK